jgi:hydrogenase maturation protein HypF
LVRALRITARGLVQGVGFRPFVFRLARERGLKGYVKNIGGSAAEVHVEGDDRSVDEFLAAMREGRHGRIVIESIEARAVEPSGYVDFVILRSDDSAHRSSMIPPDFGICEDCLKEVLSETRWKGYAFNSCVVCGPRFSMMVRSPYDREKTSMSAFPLCKDCASDYGDPGNARRFHAQGISCPRCGPSVSLYDKDFNLVDVKDPISAAASFINEGLVVAVKGIGGFHIAALASDDDVVMRLRRMKNRPTKPFAVMFRDLETTKRAAEVSAIEEGLLLSPERPIVLLRRRSDSEVSELVAPNLGHIGAFLPYTALHYLLLDKVKCHFAIMTSGNASDEPMCTDENDARVKLRGFVDLFLVHNRKIFNRVDDSVVRFTGGEPTLLRRGRGYAPAWISSPFFFDTPVVAFGGMLQNTGCVAFEDKLVLTQYIGDVDEFNCYMELKKYLRFLLENYRIDLGKSLLACDMHPEYPSTAIAEEWSKAYGAPLLKVQHHWAHLASAAAENGIGEGEHLGIAIDGAGFGTDGTVWGGEVLRFSYSSFERVGRLQLQPLLGGDKAVMFPVRMLVGILSSCMDYDGILKALMELGVLGGLPDGEAELKIVLKSSGVAVMTSSIGRVLDAISAMLGFCLRRSYEGEPAIVLEENSRPSELSLEAPITGSSFFVANTTPLVMGALELLRRGFDRREIAYAAQYALGRALGRIACMTSRRGEDKVFLSGGASVNDIILLGIKEALAERGLRLIRHRLLPPNDGCIAHGQAVVSRGLSSMS